MPTRSTLTASACVRLYSISKMHVFPVLALEKRTFSLASKRVTANIVFLVIIIIIIIIIKFGYIQSGGCEGVSWVFGIESYTGIYQRAVSIEILLESRLTK